MPLLIKVSVTVKLLLIVIVPVLVKFPVIVKVLPTVIVPVFLIVPEMVTFGIAVTVAPLIVLVAVPENVCCPVPAAVKVVALLIKLPAKL